MHSEIWSARHGCDTLVYVFITLYYERLVIQNYELYLCSTRNLFLTTDV